MACGFGLSGVNMGQWGTLSAKQAKFWLIRGHRGSLGVIPGKVESRLELAEEVTRVFGSSGLLNGLDLLDCLHPQNHLLTKKLD